MVTNPKDRTKIFTCHPKNYNSMKIHRINLKIHFQKGINQLTIIKNKKTLLMILLKNKEMELKMIKMVFLMKKCRKKWKLKILMVISHIILYLTNKLTKNKKTHSISQYWIGSLIWIKNYMKIWQMMNNIF